MARIRDPKVQIAPQYVAQQRSTRRPQHKFNIRMLPYQIQPFLLAPVLPGESLTNIMLQAQCWSDPLKPTLKNIGWWLQYNFFYVRHRDLPADVRTTLASMMIDPATDVSSLRSVAGDVKSYTYKGGIDWTNLCLEHVVEQYFRDDGEEWDASLIDGMPGARIYGKGTSDAIEKLTFAADYEDRRVDLIDAEGKLYINDLNTMYGHWAAMRDAGLMEMDYEDFMRTYGSQVRQDEESPNLHRAEDIWSIRDFTYPTNTVEPTTGVPAVAAGWRVQKAGGKRVFADEPGFLFGVCYTRPKVYMRNLKGSIAGSMDAVHKWMPAILNDQVSVSHVNFAKEAGPMHDVFADGYWIDLRDLLLYGDQFVNYSMATEAPFLSLPKADGTRRYAAQADVEAMFASAGGNFEMDGLCSLSVLGRQKATTSGLVLGQA